MLCVSNFKYSLIFLSIYREVTGYFLIYSVTHLNSLGRMFPNMTIIRGQRLFFNYAFVIYETDLTDVRIISDFLKTFNLIYLPQISLRNLLKINRGSVKIDGNNNRLCLPKVLIRSLFLSPSIKSSIFLLNFHNQLTSCP